MTYNTIGVYTWRSIMKQFVNPFDESAGAASVEEEPGKENVSPLGFQRR
jgi:hypothetical protein